MKGRAMGVNKKVPGDKAGLSYSERQGAGGETHQVAQNGEILTTANGMPIADNQNSLRQGRRGPALLEDAHFRERLFPFDHERIPERVVHARGYAAHGYFELTDSLSDVTRAAVLVPSKDFVTDAVAHSKFIGYSPEIISLCPKVDVAHDLDDACVEFGPAGDAGKFVEKCRKLHFWAREAAVDLDAKG
jgi:hypothetical protein